MCPRRGPHPRARRTRLILFPESFRFKIPQQVAARILRVSEIPKRVSRRAFPHADVARDQHLLQPGIKVPDGVVQAHHAANGEDGEDASTVLEPELITALILLDELAPALDQALPAVLYNVLWIAVL